MKVTLVVASGTHQGKSIPIIGGQFLIGRDPECQLRPASQAISKKHCAVLIRDGKVYVKDYGSTNGTLINDTLLDGNELVASNNDTLKIGPLDFVIRIEQTVPPEDGTPLPDANPEASAALAAIKAATAATPPKSPPRDTTPNPNKPAAAPKPTPKISNSGVENDQDKIAAMLLGLDDDDSNVSVPGGSTVMEAPALVDPMTGLPKPPEKKDEGPKKAQTREEMSSAASEILRKYMRRPK